jgi:hypothetical protein
MAGPVVLFAIPKNNAIHCATTYNQYLFQQITDHKITISSKKGRISFSSNQRKSGRGIIRA